MKKKETKKTKKQLGTFSFDFVLLIFSLFLMVLFFCWFFHVGVFFGESVLTMGLLYLVFLYLFFAKFNFLCSSRTLNIEHPILWSQIYIYIYNIYYNIYIYIYTCVVYHISSHLQPRFLGTTSETRQAHQVTLSGLGLNSTAVVSPTTAATCMIQQVSACSVINLSPNKIRMQNWVLFIWVLLHNIHNELHLNIAFLGVEPPFTAIYTMFNRLGPPQWEKKHEVWLKIIPSHCGCWIGISVSLWIVITNKHQ